MWDNFARLTARLAKSRVLFNNLTIYLDFSAIFSRIAPNRPLTEGRHLGATFCRRGATFWLGFQRYATACPSPHARLAFPISIELEIGFGTVKQYLSAKRRAYEFETQPGPSTGKRRRHVSGTQGEMRLWSLTGHSGGQVSKTTDYNNQGSSTPALQNDR